MSCHPHRPPWRRHFKNFRSVAQLADEFSPIEFAVPESKDYMYLKESRLYLKCKIVRSDNQPMQPSEKVSTVNIHLHSMFAQIDAILGGSTIITTSTNTYRYKSMLKTALGFGQGAKLTQLQSAAFYKDNGNMNSVSEKSGNLRRAFLFSESKSVEFEAPLHINFFSQERFILNNLSLHLKMYRARMPFLILSEET